MNLFVLLRYNDSIVPEEDALTVFGSGPGRRTRSRCGMPATSLQQDRRSTLRDEIEEDE